jgi:hypothetical protein
MQNYKAQKENFRMWWWYIGIKQGKQQINSVRIQLIEGLFVKHVNAVERKVPGRYSSENSGPSKKKKFYKQDSTNWEEIKTTETVRCVLKTVYWCDTCDMGLSVEFFLRLTHPDEFIR